MATATRLLGFALMALFVFSCQSPKIGPTDGCAADVGLTINPDHPKAAAIQALLDEYTAKGLPGISVLVDDEDGTWMGSAGYADLENQIPMQPCHMCKLGSIAKLMMGTLAWQFIQAGELSLDDPIATHIPDVAADVTNGDQITVGMLLNHTAGVYDFARDLNLNLAVINDYEQVWTEEMVLDVIRNRPATHAPGDSLSYSNSHTFLLALVIDAVAGESHRDLLRREIFERLDMENTVYYDYAEPFPRENLAQGYLDFHNDGGDLQNISALNPGNFGFTGVYSTVGDLYRFMHALMREKSLTTPENLDFIFDNMVSHEWGNWRSSFGAIHQEQIFVLENFSDAQNVRAFGHAGGDVGYSANLNYFPHNNTIYAAVYNYGTNLPSPLGNELSALRAELILLMAE